MEHIPSDLTYFVAETAADALSEPITALPPLSNAVDPDALAALVTSTGVDPPSDVTVQFTYAGLDLTVATGATVRIRAAPGDESALCSGDTAVVDRELSSVR